jgi:hypothetical protein
MKKIKNKIEEPFRPEDTPTQPDHGYIDPSVKKERGEKDGPIEAKDQHKPTQTKSNNTDAGKRLGESEIEIEDETTI